MDNILRFCRFESGRIIDDETGNDIDISFPTFKNEKEAFDYIIDNDMPLFLIN